MAGRAGRHRANALSGAHEDGGASALNQVLCSAEAMNTPEVMFSERTLPRSCSGAKAKSSWPRRADLRAFSRSAEDRRARIARLLRQPNIVLCRANRETGATGLEPATSGVTGRSSGHRVPLDAVGTLTVVRAQLDVDGVERKLKVRVGIFDRQIPVELDLDQVEKLDEI
jgi:hypothetical protein